jgi:hypothetical protein
VYERVMPAAQHKVISKGASKTIPLNLSDFVVG